MNPEQKPDAGTPPELLDTGNIEIPISTDQYEVLESRYKKIMSNLALTAVDMEGK